MCTSSCRKRIRGKLCVCNILSFADKYSVFIIFSNICKDLKYFVLKNVFWGFPGGAVVGSPPASAGDVGSSPGPGGSHVPWSKWVRVPQLLSLRSRAREPRLLSPHATSIEAHASRARAPQQEKPWQWEAPAPQRRVAPLTATRESPRAAVKTQCSQK